MISEQSFNTTLPVVQGGRKRQMRVGLYTLRSSSGLIAQVTNYGAKLVSLIVPNAKGEKADVVLGFTTLDEWRTKETYFNAVIGRVANRIKDGKFTLDGKQQKILFIYRLFLPTVISPLSFTPMTFSPAHLRSLIYSITSRVRTSPGQTKGMPGG